MQRKSRQIDPANLTPRKHPRTFTGCRTCRKRHIKCDNERPSCGPCQQFGYVCGGYWSPLRWIPENVTRSTPEVRFSSPPGYRFPILSETQRHRMSNEISKSLRKSSAHDLLAGLDADCAKLESKSGVVTEITRGPFGVFSIQDRVSCHSSSPSWSNPPASAHSAEDENDINIVVADDDDGDSNNNYHDNDNHDHGAVGIDGTLNSYTDNNDGGNGERLSDDSFEQLNEDLAFPEKDLGFTEFSDAFSLASDLGFSQDAYVTNELLGTVSALDRLCPDSLLQASTSGHLLGSEQPSLFLIDSDACSTIRQTMANGSSVVSSGTSCVPIIAPDLVPANRTVLPPHSEALLRHYKHVIFESLPNQSRNKSPWQLIFFPSALQAFAELSLFRSTSHTRYAILTCSLAVSAFHLHLTGTLDEWGGSWLDTGIQLQRQAQTHLQAALKNEVAGIGQVKYEELLMAILAISMISLSKAHRRFGVFLLDAERIIRKRGLAHEHAIPLESRLLHHMYSYLRVLAECVEAPFRPPTDGPIAELNEPPEKGGKFCLAEECYNVGLNPTLEKDPDIGYTDIHLQIQGQWKKTLFPAVYGFPESLWTHLSQTIATANEQKRIAALNPPQPELSVALQRHIGDLEKTIWNEACPSNVFGPPRPDEHLVLSPAGGDSSAGASGLHEPSAQILTQGLYHALVLFFYRKIYNVSPMLLQDTVRRALNCLEPCMDSIDTQDLTICIAWAAHTVASAAASPDLQQRALKILALTDQKDISLTRTLSKQNAELL